MFLSDLKKVTLLSRSFNFSKTSGSFNFSKTELIISEFWLLLKNFSELWDKSNFDTVLLPKIKRMWSLSKRFEIESSERSKKKKKLRRDEMARSWTLEVKGQRFVAKSQCWDSKSYSALHYHWHPYVNRRKEGCEELSFCTRARAVWRMWFYAAATSVSRSMLQVACTFSAHVRNRRVFSGDLNSRLSEFPNPKLWF